MTNAVVRGYGFNLPDRVVTSAELEAQVLAHNPKLILPPGSIEQLAGVKERRHVEPGTASSDLAAAAGLQALADADVDPLAIDLLIFSGASHDVSEPATAAMVQHKTGCRNATFVDIKNACNSFLNGLDFASAAIATGRARRVLVTCGEVISPTINLEIENLLDLQTKFAGLTLGDAGAAMVLEGPEEGEEHRGLRPGRFVSDGSHWDLSVVLYGGNLHGRDNSQWYFQCRSTDLQALAAEHLPPLVAKTLDEEGWATDELALVVPHQVSMSIVETIAEAFDFPTDRCLVTLDRFGNTAAASIPLALAMAAHDGRLQPGDKILLICGAAGFTAGVMPFVV
jgi:3-oxoacyl-[acyl-carrier-protein] synthase-3